MFSRLTGCPPPALLVTVSITHGTLSPYSFKVVLQPGEIDVAFERMEACRFEPFGYHQIVRERTGCFNVAPGGIEVRIGGDPLVCTAQNREEYMASAARP